jgi:hypothetical protein
MEHGVCCDHCCTQQVHNQQQDLLLLLQKISATVDPV